MKTRSIWIVEMKDGPLWLPTVGAALSREDAKRELTDWIQKNPDDRFRLRRYTPSR